jgi:serine/threonine protein phosphatase 1
VAEATGRLFAIGDIHGCLDELRRLLEAIPAGAGDTVVFVGDYIDRGPSSRGVIDHLLDWRTKTPARTVFLKGNHEDMALGYLGKGGQWGEAWLRNGGIAALRSYDADPHAPRADLVARIPQAHIDFMAGLDTTFAWGSYLVVHAGIRPGVPLASQKTEDLLWIREEFLDYPHDLGATVIFGHTPYRRVVVELPYKIGIDTGCVYGGALTCLELPDARVFQVRLADTTVLEDSLAVTARRRP